MRHPLILMFLGGIAGLVLSALIAAQMPSTGNWPIWSALTATVVTIGGLYAGMGLGLWLERDQ